MPIPVAIRSLIVAGTFLGLGTTPAIAQSAIGGGHSFSGFAGFPNYSLPQSYDDNHPKLVAFGSCVTRTDASGSSQLLSAYLHHAGMQESYARLAPTISRCRRRTVADMDVENPRVAAAFIISAASRQRGRPQGS